MGSPTKVTSDVISRLNQWWCTLGTRGFSRLRLEFSLFARVDTINTWQKLETALEKSLAPRVVVVVSRNVGCLIPRLYFYMIILGAATMQYLVIKYSLFLPGMADKLYQLDSRDPEDVLCDQSYSVHTNTFHLVVVQY